jgi:DNA replication protein DnaC
MNLVMERVELAAERLRLPDLSGIAASLAEDSAAKDMSFIEFLDQVLHAQVEVADRRAADTMLRLAGLPVRKTIEEFDFSFQPSVSKKQVVELAGCAFVERAENVVLLGPPGVGKTHLAVALAVEACRQRHKTRFVTAAKLITSLAEARSQGTFARRLDSFTRPSLLIIDEVGFLPLGAEEASLLFEVVSRRYERGSIILTSNKGYAEWAEVFSGDGVIATAILDRLLHHATTISIRGESYRLKDKKRAGLVGKSNKDG